MVAWINSPEHLENIMGDYTMFGSAYAFNKEGTYQHYWTQDFGSGDAEQCDGAAAPAPTPAATTPAPAPVPAATPAATDAIQNEDQVQGEADVPTQEAATPAPTTPTAEIPAKSDCESNF
ncbi:unnamed protein product [Phytophthora fragariaefolia]|uniref:Unnamed protein product n=1 Tax=Phytophthora fragariaefolia TaxID=1490495 RepID=A0A9W6Y1T3_9STRA|nr:unnamed protein product [Phytophthora fragariaefolia]